MIQGREGVGEVAAAIYIGWKHGDTQFYHAEKLIHHILLNVSESTVDKLKGLSVTQCLNHPIILINIELL